MTLIVRSLSKHYGKQVALNEVSFTLTEGIIALLGANGSGKSTLLRILATLCQPDEGELTYNGQHYGRDQRALRQEIGYVPQAAEMPDALTPRKLLTYLASLRGGDVNALLTAFNLNDTADIPFRKLSGGQIRLVSIAQAFLGHPRLLLLDEPSRGLDVHERERMYRLMTKQSGMTLFSTHLADEAERLAENVIVLHQGRVLYTGSIEALLDIAAGQVYELRLSPETLAEEKRPHPVTRIMQRGVQSIIRCLGHPPPYGAVPVEPTLEDAYLLLIRSLNFSRSRAEDLRP
jgi:ABC-2 type transport system ATP-binding protein